MQQEKTRALLIEDNPVDAQFIRQMLVRRKPDGGEASEFDVMLAGWLSAGIDLLQRHTFDVVLLDLTLPDSKGLETFQRLHEQFPDVPIVVLTGEGDETLAVNAVKGGAQDYLVKGIVNSNVLPRFLVYAMERHRLLEEVRALAHEALAREASIRAVMGRLAAGFERLALGDFKVRVSEGLESVDSDAAFTTLLRRFDTTVEQLDHLTSLNAQFHSMAAHDIRSPLSSIFFALPMLKDPKIPAERRDATLEMVRRNVRKVLALMDDLLDFFVITSGQLELAYEQVDLNELVVDCARDQEQAARDRGQKLVAIPLPGGAIAACDRMKLVRVLDNLAGNAIKYSKDGDTIEMRVLAGRVPGTLRVEVADHGEGLPESEHSLVFERFHRAPGTARKIKGSGLGLAICRDYIRAHHGEIWVESTPGKGATFIFVIPRERTLGVAKEKRTRSVPQVAAPELVGDQP